jgi:hypothetical protein
VNEETMVHPGSLAPIYKQSAMPMRDKET